MKHNVNPMKVEAGVQDILRQLGNGGMGTGEVLLVLSEALGRMIVHACDTPVQMVEMANIAGGHLRKTINVGAQAKGFRNPDMEIK